jgi:hypothetical protein
VIWSLQPTGGMSLAEPLMKMSERHAAPLRDLHLLRKDQLSRLISMAIATANGTWFRDWSRQVCAGITPGKRSFGPLSWDFSGAIQGLEDRHMRLGMRPAPQTSGLPHRQFDKPGKTPQLFAWGP